MSLKTCFVIMGFGKKTDYISGKLFDLDKTYINLIKPSVEECGYKCYRSDEITGSGVIDKYMYDLLVFADLVIADISTLNPNAIYELGVRHAVKPAKTIIIAEKGLQRNLPFDLSHINILFYEHLGEDIGFSEVQDFKVKIRSKIGDDNVNPDSPFFTLYEQFNGHQYTFNDTEKERILNYLNKEELSIYKKASQAKLLMQDNKLKEASDVWQDLTLIKPNEIYFKQQLAICVYKSNYPNMRDSLERAKGIITPLLENDNDPETMGISGSINKRLFLITNDDYYITCAIDNYQKNYVLQKNYYNGENLAICMEILGQKQGGQDLVMNLLYARKIRKEIYTNLKEMIKSSNGEIRDFWVYATISAQALYFDQIEEHKQFDEKFRINIQYPYQQNTYEEGLKHVEEVKKNCKRLLE